MEAFFENNRIAATSFFVLFSIIVGVLATLVTKLAVTIKDRAGIPDGVIGGILIGAITSVPEFIASIIVTIYGTTNPAEYNVESIFGDVIGSNMFCLLILAVTLLVTIKMYKNRGTNQINTLTIVCIIFGSIMCILAILFDNNGLIYSNNFPSPVVWHGFNLFSIFILLSYALAVFFMFADFRLRSIVFNTRSKMARKILQYDEAKKRNVLLKMPMYCLIILLTFGVVILSMSSLILSTACGACIEHWNLNDLLGHTLLLGVATSLPELIAVVTLVFGRRYNMVINSMVGSCAFNMLILSVCNAIYAGLWHQGLNPMFPMPKPGNDVSIQLIMFILMSISLLLYLILNSKYIKVRLSDRQIIIMNAILLGLVVAFYLIFIALGFLDNAHQQAFQQMI